MTVPVLSARAAQEQRMFRILLNCMARPGLVGSIGPAHEAGRFGPAIALLECVLDHEVTFAVVPKDPSVLGSLLRSSGTRAVSVEEADYVLAWSDGIETALRLAKLGTLEYPDRNGTVVALVDEISATATTGECFTVSGPGVLGTEDIWVRGFHRSLLPVLEERNAQRPLGIDLVLISPSGFITCLPRYTCVESFGV